MNRFLPLALGVVAVWAGTAAPSFAGAFGLFYRRHCCSHCNFCVRPYNAFSPLTCGVADIGCCGPWAGGGHGHGFGHQGYPAFDNGCSAFGTCGARIGFSGVPVDRSGCGKFGFGHACLGHTPPPGPPVTPPSNNCGIWFAPKPPVAQCGWYPPYGAPAGMPSLYPNPVAPQPTPTPMPVSSTPTAQPVSYPGYPQGFQPVNWNMGDNAQPHYPLWNAQDYWNLMGY
jgi:hypothetical protein